MMIRLVTCTMMTMLFAAAGNPQVFARGNEEPKIVSPPESFFEIVDEDDREAVRGF